MKRVTDKVDTLRRAVALSVVKTDPGSIVRLTKNDLPKKDPLIVARVAGISAAKKCSDLIPYCHPLPIDSVSIDYEIKEDTIVITAEVQAIWKTGVEMEALTAATVSALTIYDMLKALDKDIEITGTRLLSKKGGKSNFADKAPGGFSAAVLVTSDGTHQGKREDKSGQIIKKRLEDYNITPKYIVLPDEKTLIKEKLEALCAEGVQLILTTGGTGLGPRDVTVEATRDIMDREVPGIMEASRSYGQRRTPYAMLSRGLAVQKGNSLIVNLPGSSRGTAEALNAIFPWVLHSYGMMRGEGH